MIAYIFDTSYNLNTWLFSDDLFLHPVNFFNSMFQSMHLALKLFWQSLTNVFIFLQVGNFTYMGDGWCKDHKHEFYDFLRFSVSASVGTCSSICVRNSGFRGFSTYFTSYCYCWYSNNQLPILTDYSNVQVYDLFTAEGEIMSFQYTGLSTCYKFVPVK